MMMVLKELERQYNTSTEVLDGDLVLEGLGTPNSASVVLKNGGTEGGYLHRFGLPSDRLGVDENLAVCEVAGCSCEIPTSPNSVHPNSNIHVFDWVLN